MIDVRIGDSRDLIKEYQDNTFDCVMTSPPYWRLRDYGHEKQIGLESTPEEYLDTLLNLFDDIKIKLKNEGNCFVNLGDSYSGSSPKKAGDTDKSIIKAHRDVNASFRETRINFPPAKSLCMIPQRFAWGMIERGWILRNEIIWYKPNHMPESVTDRLTKAHEVIWHFVKHGKYYYNIDLIREKHIWADKDKRSLDGKKHTSNGKSLSNQYSINGTCYNIKGKNPGDVWSITTQPYPESHFAVFPIELVKRPILAGCPPQGHVLDPFGGSGTVAEFCRKNDRNCTIFELNPDYEQLIKERSMEMYPELSSYVSE